VATDDSTTGARACDACEIDASLVGDLSGEGRGEDAPAVVGRRVAVGDGGRAARRLDVGALDGRGAARSWSASGGRLSGRRLLRWGGCRGLTGALGRIHALAGPREHHDHRAHGNSLPFRDRKLRDGPVVKALELHRGLVGLDVGDDIAALDLLALLDVPLDDG